MHQRKGENCMVCGSALTYNEKAEAMKCVFCGRLEPGHITCGEGHYICEACHNRDARAAIEKVIFGSGSKDPFEISGFAMSIPGLPMLGCHHAYIAGGALMAAIKNEGSRNITPDEIREVFRRTEKQAHGGYCGLTGVCGIVPAIGACFSVLTGSKCGKDLEQRISMEAVTRVSRAITGLTGPSCCKAYVWASLEVAVDFLKKVFDIELSWGKGVACAYSDKHPHGCREAKCPYFEVTGAV